MQDAARPLLPLAPQPVTRPTRGAAATSMSTTASVVVPHQLQSQSQSSSPSAESTAQSSRALLPLQPKLHLTTAHLTAAAAAVAAQPVTPSPRPASVAATKKPVKLNTTRPNLVLPAPLLAAAAAAASALGSVSDDSPTSPSPSNASSSATTTPRAGSTGGKRPSRKQKKCSVSFCESYARSRGLCKAHGGGKRCKRPGCDVSDQGGGFCIRHGGGRRCLVDGCDKSAQSRHYCKAHGGGARCVVSGCEKSSQGGGLCRAHGGGPRRKRAVNNRGERVESPRSKKRTKYRAQMAARVLVGAAQAIEEQEALGEPLDRLLSEPLKCDAGPRALSFKIRRPAEADELSETNDHSETRDDDDKREDDHAPTMLRRSARRDAKKNEDHDTHMFVAASLLGMQTASTE